MRENLSHTCTKVGLFLQYHNDNYVYSYRVGHHINIISLSFLINMNPRFIAVISQLELGLKTEGFHNTSSALPVMLHSNIHYNIL